MTGTVGWVGAGDMGLPMVRRLVNAGHPVCCFDWRPERLAQARVAGAVVVDKPLALAAHCDRIFTSVYGDAALARTLAWLRPGLRAGAVLVDVSTVSPAASADVAAALAPLGVDYLRAPVSGSPAVAADGALSVYVSGPAAAFERCRGLMQTLSSHQTYLGAAEEARVAKLAINQVVVGLTALLGEALAVGEAGGVARDVLLACINSSVVATRHSQLRATSMASRYYTGTGSLRLSAKDIDMIFDTVPDLDLPLTRQVRDRMAQLIGLGLAETELSRLADIGPCGQGDRPV